MCDNKNKDSIWGQNEELGLKAEVKSIFEANFGKGARKTVRSIGKPFLDSQVDLFVSVVNFSSCHGNMRQCMPVGD